MGFIEDLKNNANKIFDIGKVAGEKAVEKGKNLAQQGKLQVDIYSLDKKITNIKTLMVDIALEQDLFKENKEIKEKIQELNELQAQKEIKEKEIELLK